MNNKIFLPSDNTYNKCYVVQNENVIRGYNKVPRNNTDYEYRDYYIHSDYIFKDGSGSWSQYATLPSCLPSDIITNDINYRVDFSNILIIFFIMSVFCFYIPIRIFKRLFRRLL